MDVCRINVEPNEGAGFLRGLMMKQLAGAGTIELRWLRMVLRNCGRDQDQERHDSIDKGTQTTLHFRDGKPP